MACRSGFGAYPALSAVGWRPETGHVLADGPRRRGIWVEGMSQRGDLDQLPMWAYIVAASRDAGVKPPLAVPFSHEWLLPGRVLDDDERAALARLDRLNDLIYDRKEAQVSGSAQSAEYDPARDADAAFSLAAYAFAFWRLCRQPITVTTHLDARPGGLRDRLAAGTGSAGAGRGPVDRVRVVQLRNAHTPQASRDRAGEGQAGAGGPRYHRRFPVRMHKVRQYYPSTGEHKVIWRGPYIKGPDGAPLLIGPKAQAVTR